MIKKEKKILVEYTSSLEREKEKYNNKRRTTRVFFLIADYKFIDN